MGKWRIEAEGLLGQDVAVKEIGSKTVRECSLACTESKKVDGEWKNTETVWFDIKDWDGRLEGSKGDVVKVAGRAETRTWQKDGKDFKRVTIHLDAFETIRSKASSGAVGAASSW